ncbi:hypothetical protein, partial [Enterovibrio norvegicus]|uniref:hypothetical protein n=1 Tax=Enterovibrio norvegicus TaxID=188144 RepID=UPI001AD84A10
AEQRIPNPRVGSSNLSTPATFKAPAEMLEPFRFCHFFKVMLGAGTPARSNLSTPDTFFVLKTAIPT